MKTVLIVLLWLISLGLALNENSYYIINFFGATAFLVFSIVIGTKTHKKRG